MAVESVPITADVSALNASLGQRVAQALALGHGVPPVPPTKKTRQDSAPTFDETEPTDLKVLPPGIRLMIVGGYRGSGVNTLCQAAVATLKIHHWAAVRIGVGSHHTVAVPNCEVCRAFDYHLEMTSHGLCKICQRALILSSLY